MRVLTSSAVAFQRLYLLIRLKPRQSGERQQRGQTQQNHASTTGGGADTAGSPGHDAAGSAAQHECGIRYECIGHLA